MNTTIMKLSDITPAGYNPRVVLKPGDEEWSALSNSLERFGLVEPLIVNTTTGLLVSGHQRLNVLKSKGVEEAEVVLVELDEEKEKLLNIALNKIDGDWDFLKLEAVFDEISAEDIKYTGFSADELQELFEVEAPEFEDDGVEDGGDQKKPEKGEEEPAQKDFNIFLSFPTKEDAEQWLKDRGVEEEFVGTARNITIRMEGLDYGPRS